MMHKGVLAEVIRQEVEVLVEVPIEYFRFEEAVSERLRATFGDINHGPERDTEVVGGVDVGVFYYYVTAETYEGFDAAAAEALALAEVVEVIAACEAAEEQARR